MSPSLSVVLNRDHLHGISVADRLTASEPTTIEITNEGEAVHVHLHLDDELSTVASLEANNHYVESGTTRAVRLDVQPASTPVTGRLKVVTGYGAETEYVAIRIEPSVEEKAPVEVDEELSRPQPDQTRGNGGVSSLSESMSDGETSLLDSAALAVAALAAAVILISLLAAAFVDVAAVLLVVGVVVGVAVATLFFLLR